MDHISRNINPYSSFTLPWWRGQNPSSRFDFRHGAITGHSLMTESMTRYPVDKKGKTVTTICMKVAQKYTARSTTDIFRLDSLLIRVRL